MWWQRNRRQYYDGIFCVWAFDNKNHKRILKIAIGIKAALINHWTRCLQHCQSALRCWKHTDAVNHTAALCVITGRWARRQRPFLIATCTQTATSRHVLLTSLSYGVLAVLCMLVCISTGSEFTGRIVNFLHLTLLRVVNVQTMYRNWLKFCPLFSI